MNLLLLWPRLTEKERRDSEMCGVHPLSGCQRAIETLLEAGREYRAAYTIIAHKLLCEWQRLERSSRRKKESLYK
jgi:hypothetical protein